MEWIQTVYDECCTIIINPTYRENMHVHSFIQDGYDYVCETCGLLGTPFKTVPKRDF